MFAIDSVGAVGSALILGVLLPLFPEYLGMPVDKLYLLAGLAIVFALYSGGCFLFSKLSSPLWLILIMTLNSSYCLFTLCLLVIYQGSVTGLGVVYFLGEIVVIGLVVALELRVLKTTYFSDPLKTEN